MLTIYLGDRYLFWDKKVSQPSGYFDDTYTVDWLNNDMAKRIIKEIDNSIHVKDYLIESPVFGGISPRDLSTGCKALLILLNEPNVVISGDRMGDNCFPILLEMAKDNDYSITLTRWINLEKYEPLNAKSGHTGKLINTDDDLMDCLCEENSSYDSNKDDRVKI